MTEGMLPENVVSLEAFRQQRERAKKPMLPAVKLTSPTRERTAIPDSETKAGRDTFVTLGNARQVCDQAWLDGPHQQRLWRNPDSLTEYTAWHLTDQEWARAKRTDPNLAHHMQVEHRIAE